MHADEVATDAALVRRLLRAQHPRWADLPIALVPSAGTDNALYRLGDEMVVRLPRIGWAVGQVELEWEWLPRLARLLPVAVPAPLAVGVPAEGYPWTWAVYRWLEGEDGAAGRIADTSQAARDLAQFVTAMQRIDLPGDPPRSPRGGPLAMRDAETRAAIAASQGMIDAGAATAAWETALGVDEWSGRPVWIHGDLLPGNLLFERGRLSAVIDFSCLGVGDPACDLLPAWAFLTAGTREIFRNALGVDDATWARGRGWALSFGLIALPYYHVTNPVLAGVARYTISEVLAEHQHS
jgi:aminoglycoside phosphotransferase (APT) family kinase protein